MWFAKNGPGCAVAGVVDLDVGEAILVNGACDAYGDRFSILPGLKRRPVDKGERPLQCVSENTSGTARNLCAGRFMGYVYQGRRRLDGGALREARDAERARSLVVDVLKKRPRVKSAQMQSGEALGTRPI